jgi:calcium/proton exchanger cax
MCPTVTTTPPLRFGNVVEIIVSIAALRKGLYTIVATSLLGSILSNVCYVLAGLVCPRSCCWVLSVPLGAPYLRSAPS